MALEDDFGRASSPAAAGFRLRPSLRGDLAKSLRRLRPDADLAFTVDAPLAGPPVLFDTCVYVDVLKGTAPAAVDRLLQTRTCLHLSLALGELSTISAG